MLQVIMMKGLPASGKSTWARDKQAKSTDKWKIISNDDLRAMLDNGTFTKSNEKFMLKVRDHLVSLSLQQGNNVIVDATHLSPNHEIRLKQLADEHGAKFIVQDFTHVPLEECIKRDLRRYNSVGERVIRRMFSQYLAPVYPVDSNLPWCVLCDLDGTLADMGERNPYDASTCEQDKLRVEVLAAVNGVLNTTCNIDLILFSGRSSQWMKETKNWLKDHGIHYAWLIMRPQGDTQSDVTLKRAFFETHIRGQYNVKAVFDDRMSVVRLWCDEYGLPVFNVGNLKEF